MVLSVRPNRKIVIGAFIFLIICVFWRLNLLHKLQKNHSVDCTIGNINGLPISQDDECVVKTIRQRFLHPPSSKTAVLEHPEVLNPSMGQSQKILEYLSNKRGGFFIECGALDGETRSNTLFMEQQMGWNGVLIEGDPDNFEKMKKKNRKAWTVSACLSPIPFPKTVMFQQAFNLGRIFTNEKPTLPPAKTKEVRVQCFPIYSILLALNRTQVDYFSLDIEGDELAVLKTIPWDHVNIHTLSVEFTHDTEGKDEIKSFMAGHGYRVIAEVTHPRRQANDFIFVKD